MYEENPEIETNNMITLLIEFISKMTFHGPEGNTINNSSIVFEVCQDIMNDRM